MTIRDIRLDRLRRLRDERFGGSGSALARAIGRSESQISQWFAGVRTISEDSARRIEKALRLTAGWMDSSAPGATISVPTPLAHLDDLAAQLDAISPAIRESVIELVRRYLADPAQRQDLRLPIEMLCRHTADDARVADHLAPAPRSRQR